MAICHFFQRLRTELVATFRGDRRLVPFCHTVAERRRVRLQPISIGVRPRVAKPAPRCRLISTGPFLSFRAESRNL